jgi:Fur family transcriptional regulator, stress-responsive regulator
VSRETSDALLRRHGMFVMPQRLAVLRAVSDRPHSTADDIYTVVRAEIGAISRQAVYDALAALTERASSGASSPPGRRPATRAGSVTTTITSSAEPAAG